MRKKPKPISVIDTNVALVANLAASAQTTEILPVDILKCVEIIEETVANKSIVIDDNNEIVNEYSHKLSFKGQPGVGDRFFKWLHDNQYCLPASQRVPIHRSGNSYQEFPDISELSEFDLSDRKFVAVSYAHPLHPPIYQATDSKWWGWKDALSSVGISVVFLCEEYIKEKYKKKIQDKRGEK